MNPLRIHFIEECVALPGKSVLDVGCGAGILSEALAQKGAHVTGIDITDELVTVARQHAEQNNLSIHYQKTTVEALSNVRFDIITCLEMLEHVPEPASVVKACAKLLKPDGQIIFSTINRTLKAYLLAVLGAEYVLNLVPRGTHDFSKFIKPSELARWSREAGFTIRTLKGVHFNPLTSTFKLTEDVSINYLLHASTT